MALRHSAPYSEYRGARAWAVGRRGARLSRGRQDWAPAHFARRPSVPRSSRRELTAQATRDVRVTALRACMMARAAREEVRRRGRTGVVGEGASL